MGRSGSASSALGGDKTNGVPRALLSRLTRGVNVTRWFCYLTPGDQKDHFAKYLTDADYQNFQRLGVRFVRLCISPDAIYSGGKLTDNLPAIDSALAQLSRHNLAVIWDLHDNGQLGLDKPNQDNSGLVRFWSAVAEHYKGKHYSDLLFEVVNEPVFTEKPDDWYALQSQVVQAIRSEEWSTGARPIGPLGLLVELEDEAWAPALRAIMGHTLCSFAVANVADRVKLKTILRQPVVPR